MIWIGKKFKTAVPIVFSIPVLFLLVQMQPVAKPKLAALQCRLQRWQIPPSSQVKQQDITAKKSTQKLKQKAKFSPLVLREKPLIPCCKGDLSCLDKQIWDKNPDKKALLNSIDQSLKYLQTRSAEITYRRYENSPITRTLIIKSLQRFRQILLASNSVYELNTTVAREFNFYQSLGKDGKGSVLFTAYYEPLYAASRVPTAEYRYPIYRLPPDLNRWPRPHPQRRELEGIDGLQGAKGKLRGLELFWFRDRLEPYMIQIQGSGRLQFPDGSQTTVGYAGNVAHNYKSIGRELANDGIFPVESITMPVILDYFQKKPEKLDVYIPRDPSFVFFQENFGAPAQGSIQVPLTAERSIATDKSLMPPGALALIRSNFPFVKSNGDLESRVVSRYVLDQDAGGAIKGAGRVDYFLGTGKIAGDRAGITVSNGQLYYLLLKDN